MIPRPADTGPGEPLWMTCRGDVLVRWEDLTLEEQQDATRQHNKLYGIES
jgi:hypothetical protein